MQGKKILVTGAAGFIGSSLIRRLVHQGARVCGLDNLSTGRIDNLAEVLPAMDFVQGDLCDTALLASLCRGVELVFHQAALPSVPGSVLDPLLSHRSNVEGTLSLLLAARRAGVRRVLYAASSSAYGNALELPKHEAMLAAPLSPYAVQKLAGEHYMQCFASVYGLETVCLRYFNVYGPFQAADSPYSGVLARFITGMLAGTPVTIFGDGAQSRDFTFIDDVVTANLLAASAPASTVSGKVYNIASGRAHSLLATHAILSQILAPCGPPLFEPGRAGDIEHSLADIRLAQQELGYQPAVGFDEGLRRTACWYGEMAAGSLTPPMSGLLSPLVSAQHPALLPMALPAARPHPPASAP